MPDVTATLQLSYGDSTPAGQNVPLRSVNTFTLTYTEESVKRVLIAAGTTDFPVTLDTITAPKLLMVRAIDVDVTVKLSDGVTNTISAAAAASGWIMIANPNGQAVNNLLITTPASPTTGAHVEVIAFE